MNTAEQLRNRPWDAHEAASFLKVSRSWIYARVEREECRTFASAAWFDSSLHNSATGHSPRIASRA